MTGKNKIYAKNKISPPLRRKGTYFSLQLEK